MHDEIAGELRALDPADSHYATRFVDVLLAAGRKRGASDLHLQPTPEGLELRWRIDGVLLPLGTYPHGVAANVIARLKVLADLLTYRNDVPQEGRMPAAGVEDVTAAKRLFPEAVVGSQLDGSQLNAETEQVFEFRSLALTP